jgi:hypothetical protein
MALVSVVLHVFRQNIYSVLISLLLYYKSLIATEYVLLPSFGQTNRLNSQLSLYFDYGSNLMPMCFTFMLAAR